MVRALVLALGVVTACVRSGSQVCSDGSVCPANATCDVRPDRTRCLTPAQDAACDGLAEGDPCMLDQLPGTCRDDFCELHFCGDGLITENEQCDGDDLGIDPRTNAPATCTAVGFHEAPGLRCSNTCRYDTSECTGGYCGDLTVNGPELCDGPTMRSCISLGFDAGTVRCDLQCGFAIRDCSRFGWNPESLSGMIAHAVGGTSRNDHWAVGMDGRAMRYEGEFWNPVPTGVQNVLIAIWAISPTDAVIVGQDRPSPPLPSVLLRWNGTAWSPFQAPAATYTDVWAESSNAIFVATSDAGVLAWNGSTWSTLGTLARPATAIRGTSASDIWVATSQAPGSDGALMRWNGAAWEIRTPLDTHVRFIDANAPDDVWVIGSSDSDPSDAVAAHWDGTAWTRWVWQSEFFNNVASSAPNDVWIAVADGSMRHFDGVAWSSTTAIGVTLDGAVGISGFMSFGANEVVAVSTRQLAYRYRGQTFGRYPFLPEFTTPLTDMWGDRADNLYVTTTKGEVLHFDGDDWSVVFQVPPPVTGGYVSLSSMWASSATDIWAAGANGLVYHYDGTSWTSLDPMTPSGLDLVWGSGPGDVWAFKGVAARKFTGTEWINHTLSGTTTLSVSGTGPNDIWVITNSLPHALWHWDGTSWTNVSSTTTIASGELRVVHALAPDNVFVAADGGVISHYDGTSWTETLVPAFGKWKAIDHSAPDDVIAATERELFHWDGLQWSPLRTPVDFQPNTPDYVPMQTIQVTLGRIDMLLASFRVRTLIRTRPLTCRLGEVATDNACNNAVDDDCDGAIDSTDSECP